MKFDSFELDPEAYVLKKSGHAVKLERIPMELLLLLSASRGRLITREEIVTHIWGKERFLDSESAVNTAMRKLRNALGEDPERPKYIETVPRRGYRFIADVADLPHHPSTSNGAPNGRNGSISVPNGLAGAVNGSVGVANGSTGAATAGVATHQTELAIAPGPAPKLQERNGYETVAPAAMPSSRRRIWIWALPVAGVAVLLLIALVVWKSRPHLPVVTNAVQITNDAKPKSYWNLPVTDGVRLYFVEGHPETTGSRIAQLSTSGGETTWITTAIPAPDAIYDISPDGSELLVGNTASGIDLDELWVQPLPAGAPHRVGNILASAASWAPDGKHIVYADGKAIIFANLDGSEPRELAKVPQTVHSIRFSPDGRRIRLHVVHVEASASSIWELNADGTNLHQLFPDWNEYANVCCGNWSPDGNFYYFRGGRGHAQDIWVLPERRAIFGKNDAAPSVLMSGLLRFSDPVPSKDGKRLFVLGEEPRVELFRYDQQAQRFDPYLSGLSVGPVDFSRDRQWVAYVTYPDATLWRSRVDGSEKMQLTFPPIRAYGPRWSPDGSKIVFGDVQFNHPWKINLISSTGGNPQALVSTPDQAEADPTWTPDGESIVFEKEKVGAGKKSAAIYRRDLKSGQSSFIPGTEALFSPRLSPDGRYISAFNQDASALVLFDTTTNQRSALATGEQLGFNEWSNDGKYVYMRCENGGAPELVRVRVKDRALEHVLSLKDFPQSNDLWALWVGLTPDDQPLLMRDRSVQELYALDLRFR